MVDLNTKNLRCVLQKWLDKNEDVVLGFDADACKTEFTKNVRISEVWNENDLSVVKAHFSFRSGEQTIVRTIEFQIKQNDQNNQKGKVIGYRPDKDTLLVEYEKTQDSAEFHDSLVWNSSSIVFGGMLVLIGLSLDNLTNLHPLVYAGVGALGLALSIFLLVVQSSLRSVKRTNYARCRAIEQILGMEQHTKVQSLYEPTEKKTGKEGLNVTEKEGKKEKVRRQTKFYQSVLVVFIIIWAFFVGYGIWGTVCTLPWGSVCSPW